MQTQSRHRPSDLLDRTFRRERDAHRPLAPIQEPPETLAVFIGFGETKQFEIVAPKHHAMIGRTLPDVAAARGGREAEPGPTGTRAFEIAHRDNHMIDTRQAVTHGLPSRKPADFTEAATPRPRPSAESDKMAEPLKAGRRASPLPPHSGMGVAQLSTIYEGAIGYNRAGPIRQGVHVSRQTELLRARRFMPLFAVQTTGAIADNLFKSAFVMLVTFGVTMRTSVDLGALSAIAGAMLIAPFFLFSALAGELADRYERAHLLRILKAAELATVLAAALALVAGSMALSFVVLFLLGVQVTFSSPVRYALLPQHLHPDELVDGNALLEGGTFLAILLGTIAGGIAVALDRGTEAACLLLALCAAPGSLRASSCRAPRPRRRHCA